MKFLNDVIEELTKYKIGKMYPGANEGDIEQLENRLGHRLPNDFRNFLKACNGFSLMSETIYGIHPGNKAEDLYLNYLWERDEAGNPIWPHLLPISPDGGGNHYCLDLRTLSQDNNVCNVVFWQHDYEFTSDNPPDVDALSFIEFVWEKLESIAEDTNYDGSDKK